MNEDEAFIRAIVDSPGDDTPRLVYADWLDDRADPRGPYLRAECEWAQAGKKWKALRARAGLDPIWVARVSRPPVGACLDHIEVDHRGPAVTETEIAEIERLHNIELPPAYRAILLNYNGGYAIDRSADVDERNSMYNWRFYPLRVRDEPSWRHELHSSLERELARVREVAASLPGYLARWYAQLICVGHDPDWRSVLLGVRTAELDAVYLLDTQGGLEWACALAMERPPDASFTALLASLPGWVK